MATLNIDKRRNAQPKFNANGLIIYRGPSMLDGKPILVIATGLASGSANEKTGSGLVQTWILPATVNPAESVHTGEDATVCGSCIHRGQIVDGRNVGRSCYVTVWQAPRNTYETAAKGRYREISDPAELAEAFAGRGVRLGAYGDPAAVPFAVWSAALSRAKFHTGYTHQWATCDRAFAAICMASCDTLQDKNSAEALGYRTFRVRQLTEKPVKGEVTCPASKEAGYKTTCDVCKACGGNTSKAKAPIVIAAHGAGGKVENYAAAIAALRV